MADQVFVDSCTRSVRSVVDMVDHLALAPRCPTFWPVHVDVCFGAAAEPVVVSLVRS